MASKNGGFKINPVKIGDEVYKLLRTRIVSHEYPSGFRFDLSRLELELEISRTPLKEALHRLEVEGLVVIRPRRGTFVISIDRKRVAENFEVRRALELYAGEIVVRAASNEEIARLKALADKMRILLANHDYQSVVEKYIRLDHEFHNLLVSFARNERLIEVFKQIEVYAQIARVRQKFTRSDSMHTESEHDAILTALERRDAPALAVALSDHIELSKARVLKVLEENA